MKILLQALLLFVIVLIARSSSVGLDDKTGNNDLERPRTAVLNFKTIDCDPSLGLYSPDVLSRELNKLSNNKVLIVIGRNLIKKFLQRYSLDKQSCYDNAFDCVIDSEKQFNADKRVVGSIELIERKTGEEQINKYVYKELVQEEYSISIKVIDIKKHRIELELNENTDDKDKIAGAMKNMAKKIIKYYSKPLSKKVSEKVIEKVSEVEIKETPRKSSFGIRFDGISASGAFIKTFGKYRNIMDYGFGANVDIYSVVYPFPNYLTFCLGLYSLKDEHIKTIKSDYIIDPLIKIGHRFLSPKGFNFSLYAGAGYIFSIINGDVNGADLSGNYDYSKEYYYNPTVSAGLEIAFPLYSNYHILLNPSYSVFFEKGEIGQFLTIAVGLKRSF